MCGIDDAAILDFETHEVLPPCPAELAWREQVQMLANSFAIYLVQLRSTGERGLLLVSEYSHQGSAVEEGLGPCDEMGGEREVWELVASLAEEYRRRQFRVLVGRGTGPFGRHELGIFFSWDDIAREKSFFERLAEAEDILYSGWDVPCRSISNPRARDF